MQASLVCTVSAINLKYNVNFNSLAGDVTFRAILNIEEISPGEPYPEDGLIFVSANDPVIHVDSEWGENGLIRVITLSINSVLPQGDYNFKLIISSSYASNDPIEVPIYLSVVNENYDGSDVKEYNLKYIIENENIVNDLYVLEIYEDRFEGDVKYIQGSVTHNYQSKTDLFDPIIASNLKLSIDSSVESPFEDLYSEEEQHFKVILKRNGAPIFIGFLKPDGIFEDFVRDKWLLDIEAYDGLSTLKDISFLNSNGISFSGRMKVIDIIYNCLLKTGLNLPININIQLHYVEEYISYDNSVFGFIFVNTERFYQNANEPMNCDYVLRGLLQVFNCELIQFNGEWFIFRPIDVVGEMGFARYEDSIYKNQIQLNTTIDLGSQINGSEIIHCNGNQQKSIAASVQAYRIFYEYGAANSVFNNGRLRLEGSGLDIPGWTVINPDGDVYRNESGYGIYGITKYFNNNAPAMLVLNQTVNITEGFVFKVVINFANESELRYGQTSLSSNGLTFSLGIGDNWLKADGSWGTNQERIFIKNSDDIKDNINPPPGNPILVDATFGKGDATYDFNVRAPYSGMLKMIIWRDKQETGGGKFRINSIDLSGTNDSEIKGKDYTAERTRKVSTVTKSNITVNNGDSASDVIIGTIFKADADTPTTQWFRYGRNEAKEILAINAEDNLRISPRSMYLFEGDVFGYIPYISLINISGINGKKFQPIEYSFNTTKNQLRLNSKEFSSDYLDDSEFSVYATNNYGNETKVTITS